MKIKYILAAAFICAVAAASLFWINRNPLARLNSPTGYIYADLAIIDAETGQEAALDDYGPFGGMFAAMAEEMVKALEQGVLIVDPAAGHATLLAAGTSATAPLPERGQEVAFDAGTSGSAPIFLSYSPADDRFTLRAPETALEVGLSFHASFVPAPDGAKDRISAQEAMQAARADALSQWNGAMDRLQADLARKPDPMAGTYRLNLPGDFATIAVPFAATYDDSDDTGQTGVVDRVTGRTLFNLHLDTAEALTQRLSAHRKEYLGPDDGTRILHEDDRTLIVARRDRPFFFLRIFIPGDIGYAVHGDFEDLAQLQTARAAAESLSEQKPDPGVIDTAGFDAMAWFRDQGTRLTARTEYNTTISDAFGEQLAEELVAGKLLSGQSKIRGTIRLRDSDKADDPFATLFDVNYACLPRRMTNDSPVALHERLSTSPFFDGLAHRDTGLDMIAASIAHNAIEPGSDYVFDPKTDQPTRLPPVWAWQSPMDAFGADNLSYFAYRVRDLDGRFQLVCATSSENPYAAQAGLQILNNQPLPDLSELPSLISDRFEHYAAAFPIGDGLFKVQEAQDKGYQLIDANGAKLTDAAFESSWDHRDSRVFDTTDAKGKSALWSYAGEQLLPYEYDDFDDGPNGIVSARKGDQTLYYSVAERRFVPEP